MTNTIADTGSDARTLTVTNFPIFEGTGTIGSGKAIKFYNPDAGSDIDMAGGSVWLPDAEIYVPDGGMAIEIVCMPPDITSGYSSSQGDGMLIFSLNGDNKRPNYTIGGIVLYSKTVSPYGLAAGCVCSEYGCRTPGWAPSSGEINILGDGVGDNSLLGGNLANMPSSQFSHIVLNITYDRSVDSDTAHFDFYLNKTNIFKDIPGKVPYVDFGVGDNRMPIFSYNIGGFEYDGSTTPVLQSTRSYNGWINQVRMFDHPLGAAAVTALCDGYGLPKA